MTAKHMNTAWNIALAITIFGTVAGTYFSAYVLRGEREIATRRSGQKVIINTYPTRWEASVFKPAAIIEGYITGCEVYPHDPYRLDFVLFQLLNGDLILDDESLTANPPPEP